MLLPTWVLGMAPAMAAGHLTETAFEDHLMVVLWPAVDAALLLYVVQGIVGARRRAPGLWAIVAIFTLQFSGDLPFAVISDRTVATTWCNAIQVLAYIPIAFAASAPMIRTVMAPADFSTPRSESQSLAVMLIALTPVAWLYFISGPVNALDRVVRTVIVIAVLGSFSARLITMNRSLARQRRQAQHRALHDPLTGLLNRAGVSAELATRLRTDDLTVLYLDLDGFKAVNDTWGHPVGDVLLRRVVERIEQSLRGADRLGRLGGDEFLILTDCPAPDLTVLVRRVQTAVSTPIHIDERVGAVRVSASIGGAFARAGTDPEVPLGQADLAMFKVKQSGKAAFVMFTPDLALPAARRAALSQGLAHALDRREMAVVYQPIVATHGVGKGYEALLRWNSADLGRVPADEFIEIAESDGVIHRLGRWVLDQACQQLAEWRLQPEGHHLHLSVNLSARQLDDPRFVEYVFATLARYAVPARCLWLELTERVFVSPYSGAVDALRRLREAGVTIAIDDFGTGTSALSYLRDRVADVIKIDRSFVARADEPGFEQAMMQGLTATARQLGMQIVAEGVKTPEQSRAATRIGCDWQQGYLLGQPTAAPALQDHPALPGMPSLDGTAATERDDEPGIPRQRRTGRRGSPQDTAG